MFHGNVIVLELAGLVFGARQQAVQARGNIHFAGGTARAGDFGQAVEVGFQAGGKRLDGDSGFGKDGRREASLLLQKRRQQVLHIDLLVSVADRLALGGSDRLLQLLSEPIDIHTLVLTEAGASRTGCSVKYVTPATAGFPGPLIRRSTDAVRMLTGSRNGRPGEGIQLI